MRTTVTIADTLFENAAKAADEKNVSSLITKALTLLIATESKKRLLRLSGAAPSFTIPTRDARLKAAEDQSGYNS
ncbi:MAG: type II toxin-antitoxin system VapB family antitoxin [Verrucomicrobia bacterium]|nr:type II toxin-antitoxin system VapB family antitoxin [Verrucomicrobiota bacterium]